MCFVNFILFLNFNDQYINLEDISRIEILLISSEHNEQYTAKFLSPQTNNCMNDKIKVIKTALFLRFDLSLVKEDKAS